ncbi:clavesin-2-like isoform X2 [Lethenteron reissneri]|uniref:clavesin-2-like isoform X2 n=1 Tax=Lethenteron reissneri TaxID=7753 RepID=UPI002AB7C242|nr:clavesin-2-like isoform X2 [Lethenteron reissneri]
MMTHALQSGLRADTLEKARVELCERPDAIQQDIQEVRDMIVTRPDIGFLRTDDAFVLRFLRARKFHHFEAFKLLAQYFEYRQQHLDMFKNFKATDQGIRQALRNGFPGVLSHSDHYGRKILVIFASNWDQIRYTFVDILRAILLSLETMIEEPELQVNGFVLIIDWSNFSFKQASKLTPGMLRLAIEGLQIFLHGNNLTSLHQLLHPEILPSEFGGNLPPYDMGTWARALLGPGYDDNDAEGAGAPHATLDGGGDGGGGGGGLLIVGRPGAAEEQEDGGCCSQRHIKRSQSVVERGTLQSVDKEEDNTQPLLSLD